jgi:hypothetical protein
MSVRGLPEDGAEIEAELARYAHAAFEQARKEGRREGSDAYRYDGLVALVRAHAAARRAATTTTRPTGPAPAPAPGPGPATVQPVDLDDLTARFDRRVEDLRTSPVPITPIAAPKGASVNETKTFVHIDLETLLRGRTEPGSICDIDGIGPIDVQWVRETIGDSFVVLLLKDGPRIIDLVHDGRDATALQRSYKEAQGIHCERPGCSCTKGLELHHTRPWSPTQQTTVTDLAWLCGHDHDLVTHHGHTLTGPPGARTWTTPDGTTAAQQRPPPDTDTEARGADVPSELGSQFGVFA